MFGAVGSVWGYNRFGDALCHVARIFMGILAIHYVDDYGAVDSPDTADSSFLDFETLNNLIGWRMKASKRQPPDKIQKVQGVNIHFHFGPAEPNSTVRGDESADSNSTARGEENSKTHKASADTDMCHASCRPAPQRVLRITKWIQTFLDNNKLTPAEAAELAGKLVFLSTTMFGKLGRAALRCVYGRQHSPSPNTKLTRTIVAALRTLLSVITTAPPRTICFRPSSSSATGRLPVIYADAFFLLGDMRLSPGKADEIPAEWDPSKAPKLPNGWGAVIFPQRDGWPAAFTMRGEVPDSIVKRFCTRRAFIYFLEAWAQCAPLWCMANILAGPYVSFCDNEAACHALIKGYGKDEGINSLISMFWASAAQSNCDPWLERVSSKANISDGISRDDFTLARLHGWIHLDIDFDCIWPALLQAADDIEYALTRGHLDICNALQPQVQRTIGKILGTA